MVRVTAFASFLVSAIAVQATSNTLPGAYLVEFEDGKVRDASGAAIALPAGEVVQMQKQ